MTAPDVVVIGGGICGTAASALLAEAGVRVDLVEQSEIGAGASGRNSGSIQHPLEPALAELHLRSLALYRELAAADVDAGGDEFRMPSTHAGVLLVTDEPAMAREELAAVGPWGAAVRPALLDPDALRRHEPALAEGLSAVRLETGYPVVPSSATAGFARRAARAGVEFLLGEAATLEVREGSVAGVSLASGRRLAARQVLVAAGPWTPALVPGWAERPPIRPVWGVVVAARLAAPPAEILEEIGIDAIASLPTAFSLVTAGGSSSIGSTFLAQRPEPSVLAGTIVERAARFVPALAGARMTGVRACARPVSFDGRPLVGAVPGVAGLYVCAGHGPWGISTGPASSEMIVEEMLGRSSAASEAVRGALSPARWTGRQL